VSDWAHLIWSGMTDLGIDAELRGGPQDGHQCKIPSDVGTYWVGPLEASWAAESGLAPENVVGGNLHAYRRTDQVTDGGRVIFAWIEPQA